MAFRLYLIPENTRISPTGETIREPKYAEILEVASHACMDFGFEPVFLVGADLATADETLLLANPDVTALPINLDQNLTTAQVTNIQAKLEAHNIPAGWVSTSLTWRQLVRLVTGMFQFLQRLNGIQGAIRFFAGGITLGMTWAELPPSVQTALLDAANSFGYSTAGLTGSTTIRAILKNLADQWGSRRIVILGREI